MSSASRTVVVLVGSLRRESINRRIARLVAEQAADGVDVQIIEGLDALPFYNEDLDVEGVRGAGVDALRARVADADAVLLVTPEYNGGLPAVLKNAIDWLSRPFGESALSGKQVGVIGSALGRYAGTWSRQDARKAVGIAGAVVVEAVEVGIAAGEVEVGETGDARLAEQVVGVLDTLMGELVGAR